MIRIIVGSPGSSPSRRPCGGVFPRRAASGGLFSVLRLFSFVLRLVRALLRAFPRLGAGAARKGKRTGDFL